MFQNPSPFHQGEQEAQTRAGVREAAERLGQQMVRDFMPDQHRQFYNQLPLLLVGSVDPSGQPWASVVVGKPGFVTSPDARKLVFTTSLLPHDPLIEGLQEGAQLGLLGLEFSTRRRNRMNGKVTCIRADGFEMQVGQSFGNCPQYIQKRRLKWRDPQPPVLIRGTRLTPEVQSLIQSADTFFIASAHALQGSDVSHRGGKPGFVKVEDAQTLVFPDFRGNNHFNTIGNLLVNPKAGLLFFNYHTGEVLYLTTRTEIVWDGPELEAFEGAQRLVRFRVVEWRLVEGSFPFSWDFEEFSPTLAETGQWTASALFEYIVSRIDQESRSIKSFYLSPVGGAAPNFKAGQHLPLQLPVEAGKDPIIRTYTLSQAPGKPQLRLTVKREEMGSASVYLHDRVKVGDRLRAKAPAGEFVLDVESARPVVLLSAGVGITPMVSMLQHLTKEEPERRVYFLHGARNAAEQVLRSEVEALKAPHVQVHFRYSQPVEGTGQGRVDIEWLQSILPFGNYDFYLCGPHGFLQSLYTGLKALGVPKQQVHFETFGSTLELERVEKRTVEFRKSQKVLDWRGGSLLELAEKNDISAPFSCRSGACGSCSSRLISGEVEYLRKPSFEVPEGEVLVCSARPRSAAPADQPLVLDL